MRTLRTLTALAIGLALGASAAAAKDKIKVVAPHPTILPSTFTLLAEEFGFNARENLDVEVLWTAGGADAQQATVNGSVDLAVQTGIAGVLSAIQQGAPLMIVAADSTGANDLYWYVRADKPYKTLADVPAGGAIGFSRPGSSSDLVARTLIEHFQSKGRATPTGSPPETLTQVMSGQIEVGWGTAPYPKEIKEGKARVIARGNNSPKLANLTIRVHAVNSRFAEKNPQAVKSFLKAYNNTISASYTDPKVQARMAALLKVTPDELKQIMVDMFPRSTFVMSKIGELDTSIAQAIANKQLKAPITDAQKSAILKAVADFAPAN